MVLPHGPNVTRGMASMKDNYTVSRYVLSRLREIGVRHLFGVALARPEKRPVVLTGDGAFQMTAQEISTLIRRRCPAVIVLINNGGYLVERLLHEDGPYNDIQMWQYSRLPGVLGDGSGAVGMRVATEEELAEAMSVAARERDKFVLVEACLPGGDCCDGLRRLGESFRRAQEKK